MKNPTLEALKEIGRWLFFFAVSWFITETLKQAVAIPETYALNVWVFTYAIPVRLLFQFVLTGLGRFADRWVHENPDVPLKGLVPRFLN